MAYLANRSVTQRNTAVVASTMTTDTLSVLSTMISLGPNTHSAFVNPSQGLHSVGSWNNVSSTLSLHNVREVGSSSTGQYQLALQEGDGLLYLSSNSGQSWTALGETNGLPTDLANYKSASISSSGQYILIALDSDYVYRSTNYGATFSAINTSSSQIYFPFDNNTTDTIGGATSITETGTIAYVSGPVTGQAMNLVNSAGSTAINYVTSSISQSSSYTVSGWFNVQSVSGQGVIFSLGNTSSTSAFLLIANGSNTISMEFRITGGIWRVITYPLLSLNTWYHFHCIYDASGTSFFYLNGNLVGTAASGVLDTSVTTLRFGAYTNEAVGAFNGYIDDFRITNSVVTDFPLVKGPYSKVTVSGDGTRMIITNRLGYLYLSSDSGNTWSLKSAIKTPGAWTSLSASENGQYLTALSQPVFSPNSTNLASSTWSANKRVQYTVTSSSTYNGSYPAYGAFNKNDSSTTWVSSLAYVNGTGIYNGSTTTTVQGMGEILGEWLQLELTSPHVLYSYTYSCPGHTQLPKRYYIIGSNDSTQWFPIQYCDGITNPCTVTYAKCNTDLLVNYNGLQSITANIKGSVSTTSYSTSDTPYRYYRIIITTTWGDRSAGFGELYLNYMGGFIMPTVLSTTGSATWIESGVTWKVSSSSGNAAPLFNSNVDDYWGTPGGLYASGWSGAYIGTTTTAVEGIGNVVGEWAQLETSVPLIMHSYIFSQTWTSPWTVPNLYYIVGSNDGTTWYPVHYASMGSAGYNYFGSYRYSNDILVNYTGQQLLIGSNATNGTTTSYVTSNTPYVFFRLIINKTIGSSGRTDLSFSEFCPRFIGGQYYSTDYGATWSYSIPFGDAYNIRKNLTITTNGSGIVQLPAFTPISHGVTPGDRAFGLTISARFILLSTPATYTRLFDAATTTGGIPISYLAIYFNSNLTLTFVQRINGVDTPRFTSSATCTIGKECHVVWTIDALGAHRIYFNGVESNVSSGTRSGNMAVTTYPYVYIGKSNFTENSYPDMVVSDFRMVNRMLNQAEVASLYANANYAQPAIRSLTLSGNGKYALTCNNTVAGMDSNYLAGYGSSTLVTPLLPSINAPLVNSAISSDGKYMLFITSGSSNHVYYSTDYGSTFTVSSVGTKGLTSCDMATDGSQLVVSNPTTVYTLDMDGSWVNTTNGITLSNSREVAMSSNAQYQLVIHEKTNVLYLSSDSGQTWSTLGSSNGLPTGTSSYLSGSLSADGRVMILAIDGDYLYRSMDYGVTFTPVNTASTQVYLPFDGNIYDAEGGENPTVTGSVTYVPGPVTGQAVSLVNTAGSAPTNYIRGSYSLGSNFTLSCWFNMQSYPANTQIATILSVGGNSAGSVHIFYLNNNGGRTGLYSEAFILNGPSVIAAGFVPTILLNTWYHVYVIYQSAGVYSLYVNGSLVGSITGQTLVNNPTGYGIGTYSQFVATSDAFNGYIDDVRLMNSAVTNFPLVKGPWTRVSVSGNGSYLLAGNRFGCLFSSTDSGSTWTHQTTAQSAGPWNQLSLSHTGQYQTAISKKTVTPNQTGLAAATWAQDGVTWTVSASSFATVGYESYRVFNNAFTDTNTWASASTYPNGSYTGSVSTVIQGGIGTINGEWIQFQSSIPLILESYTYASGVVVQLPKVYYIVGSNDGTNWYPIQYVSMTTNPFTSNYVKASNHLIINYTGTQTIQGNQTGSGSTTSYPTSVSTYSHFRMVIVSVWPFSGSGAAELGEFYPTFLADNVFSPQQTVNTASTWQTSGITWNASASATSAGYNIYSAFDTSTGIWASSSNSYSNSTGDYLGSTTTTIQGIGNIQGEWLQLKSSVPLVLQSYTYGIGNEAKVLKTYYLIGSNDGTTWYPIHYFTITTNPFTSIYAIASTYLLTTISGTQSLIANIEGSGTGTTYSTSTSAFTYFRMVINNIWSNAGNTLNNVDIRGLYFNFIGGQNYSVNYGSTWSPSLSYGDAFNVTKNTIVTSGGASGYATLPSFTPTTVGLTLSGWFILNETPVIYSRLLDLGDNFRNPYPSNSLHVFFNTDGTIGCGILSNSVQNPYMFSTTTCVVGTLYHFVWTITGTNQHTMYINGVQEATLTITIPIVTFPYFYLGRSNWPDGQSAISIRDFRMFNRGLNATEVALLYANQNYGMPSLTYLTPSGNGKYSVGSNKQNLFIASNYQAGFGSSTYSSPALLDINAPIVDTAVNHTGQYIVVVTSGTTNNVYYSIDYGVTFIGASIGSLAMTSCSISYDGSWIMVSNSSQTYTLNRNLTGFSLAIGSQAGHMSQGANAVAIGNQAGKWNQSANSIVVNATGSQVSTLGSGLYVAPIADAASSASTYLSLLGYGTDQQVVQTGLTTYTTGSGFSGNVGIGTSLPLEGLHSRDVIIVGSTSRGLIRFTTDNGANYIQSALTATGSSVAPLYFTGYYGGPIHMAISSNGYVGIGSVTPRSALDVNGVITVGTGDNVGGQGININTGWLNPTNYYEWAPLKVSVRNTPVFNVNTQGFVGIGTTAPANRIHIHSATANYDPGFLITHSATTGGLTCGLAGVNGSYAVNAVAGDAVFRNEDASKKVHLVAGAGNAVMTVTNSSVGIGTTTPTYPLEIYKNTSALSSVDALGLKISAIAGTAGSSKTYGLWVSATGSDDANYAAIFNEGNVGIGTSSPVTSLEACGSSGVFAPLTLTRTGAGPYWGVATLYSLVDGVNSFRGYYARVFGGSFGTPATSSQTQANGYYAIDVANNGVFASDTEGIYSKFYITATKSWFNTNVGIGITTPNAELQLSTTLGNRKIVLWENANDDHQYYGFGINSSTLRYQVDSTSANHIFYAAASGSASNELMRIQGNGRVGIGVTNPSAALTVNGNIYQNAVENAVFTIDAGNLGRLGFFKQSGYSPKIVAGSASPIIFSQLSSGDLTTASSSSTVNDRMTIDSSGNVGIGTTTPGHALDVIGNIRASGHWYWAPLRNWYCTATAANQDFTFDLLNQTTYSGCMWSVWSDKNSRSVLTVTGDTERVGILTNTPGYTLHVIGDIYASGNITGLSDRRFKTQIEPLVGALERLSVVNGYTYFRPDHRPNERQMGLIAQEVQEVYPEAVTYDKENDRYGVNYNAMIAPLVQAMKEMRSEYNTMISQLKEEISSLKAGRLM